MTTVKSCLLLMIAFAVGAGVMFGWHAHGPGARFKIAAADPPGTQQVQLATEVQASRLQRTLDLSRVERNHETKAVFETVVAGVEQLRGELAMVSAQVKALADRAEALEVAKRPPPAPAAPKAPTKKATTATKGDPPSAWPAILKPFIKL